MISRRLARLPASLEAPDLVLDLLFAEALVVEGVPCVHDQPDTPEDDREDRPEEALPGHRPDPDDEAVYQGEDQQVGVEVAALLQPLDRPVANRDITIVARGFAARHRRHPLSSLTLRRRSSAAKCHWSPAHDGSMRTGRHRSELCAAWFSPASRSACSDHSGMAARPWQTYWPRQPGVRPGDQLSIGEQAADRM